MAINSMRNSRSINRFQDKKFSPFDHKSLTILHYYKNTEEICLYFI